MALARIIAAEKEIEKLTASVERLDLENSVLQKFNEKKQVELGPDEDDKKKKKTRKAIPTVLTIEQKVEIANIIAEDLHAEIVAIKNSSVNWKDASESEELALPEKLTQVFDYVKEHPDVLDEREQPWAVPRVLPKRGEVARAR